MGQKRVKNVFSQRYDGPFGMLKQAVFASSQPVVTGFGPWKIPKPLENGLFWNQRWVNNGSKTHFRIGDPTSFRMLRQLFLARFEPMVKHYVPWKIPKCLENGPFWAQTWVTEGSKTDFSNRYYEPFGMLKESFFAEFEPVVTRFGPWKMPKRLENGLF